MQHRLGDGHKLAATAQSMFEACICHRKCGVRLPQRLPTILGDEPGEFLGLEIGCLRP